MTKEINYHQEGNQVCATFNGFINLQKSIAWFGDTKDDAKLDLYRQYTLANRRGNHLTVRHEGIEWVVSYADIWWLDVYCVTEGNNDCANRFAWDEIEFEKPVDINLAPNGTIAYRKWVQQWINPANENFESTVKHLIDVLEKISERSDWLTVLSKRYWISWLVGEDWEIDTSLDQEIEELHNEMISILL